MSEQGLNAEGFPEESISERDFTTSFKGFDFQLENRAGTFAFLYDDVEETDIYEAVIVSRVPTEDGRKVIRIRANGRTPDSLHLFVLVADAKTGMPSIHSSHASEQGYAKRFPNGNYPGFAKTIQDCQDKLSHIVALAFKGFDDPKPFEFKLLYHPELNEAGKAFSIAVKYGE